MGDYDTLAYLIVMLGRRFVGQAKDWWRAASTRPRTKYIWSAPTLSAYNVTWIYFRAPPPLPGSGTTDPFLRPPVGGPVLVYLIGMWAKLSGNMVGRPWCQSDKTSWSHLTSVPQAMWKKLTYSLVTHVVRTPAIESNLAWDLQDCFPSFLAYPWCHMLTEGTLCCWTAIELYCTHALNLTSSKWINGSS